MNFSRSTLHVSDLVVDFVRKDIKNVHLSVLPPEGQIRLTAPLSMTDDNARLAVVARWSWIKKRQKEFWTQNRESERRYVDGETHYFDGHPYLLSLAATKKASHVRVAGNGRIELFCRSGIGHETKQKAFEAFYRDHLKATVASKLSFYCGLLDVDVPEVRIQRMRTKWGSCNTKTNRVLINLELAKKPVSCVQYILAHELTHLRVRHHNRQFSGVLESIMPDWRCHRDVLNALPLAYEEW